jgi:hypothetical protein
MKVIQRIIQGLKPSAAILRGWSRTPFSDEPKDDETKIAISTKAMTVTIRVNQ